MTPLDQIALALAAVIHRQNLIMAQMEASFRLHEETSNTFTAMAAAIVMLQETRK